MLIAITSTEPSAPARGWTRLDGVDLLRGLAIFLVLMNHVNIRLLGAKVPYTAGLPPQLVRSLVWNGQFGVQIFFAVSGFLIASTTRRRWGSLSDVNVRDFYRLRFARIAPLLLLLMAVLCTLHFAHVNHFVVSARTGGLGRALLAVFTLHVNVLEAGRGYLPANWDILWSLSVEEMFYLAFPLVCWWLGRGKLLVLLLLAFVAIGPFGRTVFTHGNDIWREYSYLGGMDAIALGCLTAVWLEGRRLSGPVLWTIGSIGAVLMTFTLGWTITADKWGLGRNGLDMTILACGTCLAIVVAAQTEWRAPRVFRPFTAIGQRSYEVYLTHMFVVFALFDQFVAAGKPIRMVAPLFLATIVLSGVLGELVARGYSDPINRSLRHYWGIGRVKLGSGLPTR